MPRRSGLVESGASSSVAPEALTPMRMVEPSAGMSCNGALSLRTIPGGA
eukprot:CAMPEP_0185165226 /NCGR_PEP_ID=MMETSP1139-20130426/10612_1 /TAXON_ID=298111 /ORGANISM="Pavlova sp., Strain CCMP459" /LENGTH=48 /DNA_ID= /DNA_START= /DNA_END= /DNA_ORIENTATION=